MKVLMFGWEFPPFVSGGLGTACYGLTKGLVELGIDVDFVLPTTKGKPLNQGLSINIIDASQVDISDEMYCLGKYDKHLNFLIYETKIKPYQTEETYLNDKSDVLGISKQTSFEKKSDKLRFEGGYGKTLMEEVFRLQAIGDQLGKRTNANIIHAHDWMTFPAAIAAKKSSGLPLVVHVHATEYDRVGRIVYSKAYDLEKEGMMNADRVVTVSKRTKNIISKYYDIPEEKIDVVYNAVNEKDPIEIKFEKQFKEPLVLFLGRITSQKGPGYFLETARLVLSKKKNVRFVMAGTGDLLPDMVRLCASMRLQDHFHFTGFLQGENLKRIFKICDLLVMPSVSEPFGIVPMEALKNNMPIIISKQSGVAEVLPHAHKIDFWDTHLFSEAILEIINDPIEKQKTLEDNLKTLDSISWTRSAEILVNIYMNVLQH